MESMTPYFVKQVDESDVGYSLHFKGDKASLGTNTKISRREMAVGSNR
jgi:hypothetical protein